MSSSAEHVADHGFSVRELHPALGAEISGLDLSQTLDDETIASIREVWADRLVLVFPEQSLSEEAQVAFTGRFGEMAVHLDEEKRSEQAPEIFRVGNVDPDGAKLDPDHFLPRYFRVLTGLWHTDGSYKAIPSFGSMLHAKEVPPEGGDTCFANMFLAYASLAPEVKARIETLHMVHSHDFTRVLCPNQPPVTEAQQAALPPVTHPLVRTHARGRRSLFISENVAYYVGGMALEEGKALHRELVSFATRPEFVYQHKWRQGDVVMWDNRPTMHRVTEYDGARYRRNMQRTELLGLEPVR